jgi:hypothetical protein
MIDATNDQIRRLADDLLWLNAGTGIRGDMRDAVDLMIADYTADPNRYSEGSPYGNTTTSTMAAPVAAVSPSLPALSFICRHTGATSSGGDMSTG